MKFREAALKGAWIIEPQVYQDERGYFFESFNYDLFTNNIGEINFIQDNESYSTLGVLRGLHYQKSPFEQAKLVRVTKGRVLDVIVDIRPKSETYLKHFKIELSEKNKKQLFVPRGFAHAYLVLSDDAIFQYKVDNVYSPNYEAGLLYNDPILAIDWGFSIEDIIINEKDLQYSKLGANAN